MAASKAGISWPPKPVSLRNDAVIHKQKSIGYKPSAERIGGTLSARYARDPEIIVEPTLTGLYRVNVRPICSRRDLERTFSYPGDALDYAAMLEMDHGWPLVDQTGGGA